MKNGTLTLIMNKIFVTGLVGSLVAVIATEPVENSNTLVHPVETTSAPDNPALAFNPYLGSSNSYDTSGIINAKDFPDCFGGQILD